MLCPIMQGLLLSLLTHSLSISQQHSCVLPQLSCRVCVLQHEF